MLMKALNNIFMSFLLLLWDVTWGDLADDFNIPNGWRMQDRYHGFRYEAKLGSDCQLYPQTAVVAADELACFGWVQWTSRDSVAGEGRCSKATGGRLQDQLRQGPGGGCVVREFEVKDYKDTKIKLHFSHFKILDGARKTCFRDPPHQCPEFANTGEQHTCANGASIDADCS